MAIPDDYLEAVVAIIKAAEGIDPELIEEDQFVIFGDHLADLGFYTFFVEGDDAHLGVRRIPLTTETT